MTKKEILMSMGLDPNNPQDIKKFYEQYPTQESFQMAMGGMVDGYKKGGWIQKATASIKRRGTEGVCTGSKFGGPTCRPGTRRYALAKTFRKMAKARKKEDGGTVDMYEEGGENSTWKEGPVSQRDSVANMARNTMIWEANRGSGAGTGLSNFGNPALSPGASIDESVDWYMQNIYPKLEAYPTAMEKASAGDFLYNTGKNLLNYTDWDNRKNDTAALASWEEKLKTLTPNERRIALNNARDRYYKNTAPAGSTWDLKTQGPHPAYWNTWYGRQHATDQYTPLTDQDVTNRANKKFYPVQKANGGVVDVYQLMGMPTPAMYGMGGIASIVPDSRVISRQNFPNMGMAMGGGVDGPNLLQVDTGNMPKFAMGAEPQEKEMTLKEKYQAYLGAKPVAKYTNFPRHPKVGIDPRGTVTGTVDEQGNPVQINTEGSEANWKLGNGENFITVANNGGKLSTKRAEAFYNNHDNIALAALMNNTVLAKEAKEAANQVGVGKYGGPVKGMYAQGGMIPMYQDGALARAMQKAPMNPFLANLMQNANTGVQNANTANPTLSGPAARPYNSNVSMGTGLSNAIANYMDPNNFYLTGPGYTVNPGTTGTPSGRSVQNILNNVQPSPFFQRLTQGVQPSPFLQPRTTAPSAQRVSPTRTQPATQASTQTNTQTRPSTVTPAGNSTSSNRFSYSNRPATSTGTTARPATANRATRPTFDPMTPMTPRGIDLNQLNLTNTPSTYTDNFDSGNIGEANRAYETYTTGPEQQVYPINANRELTADELFNTNNDNSWVNRNMDNILIGSQLLPAAYNFGRALFEKPWIPGSYETPANTQWQDVTGEEGRRDMLRAYNLAKYNARQLPGSNTLAGLIANANNYYNSLAAYNENLENTNKLGRTEIGKFNKAIEQANMQMRMNRDYLAQQSRENKAAGIGKGLENIGSAAGQLWQNRQYLKALELASGKKITK